MKSELQSVARYDLACAEQIQMLRKLLLYWDGQWFLKSVETLGLEAAIDLNARVRAAFGRIEMRLLLKTLGKPRADDMEDAMHLLDTYAKVFMGGRIRAKFSALSDQQAEVIIQRCAAYEGALRARLERVDQACVACETLWNVWMETLLPGVRIDVGYPQRQGKGDPLCQFILRADAGQMEG